ncbi:MAG: acetoacetate decarboxylase [Trueperaceae bacterium]
MSEDFSTPLGAPLVPKLPIRFRDTTILSVPYQTDLGAAAKFLPEPLEAVSDTVLLHFYRMGDPEWFGPHFEFAVQIDALLPDSEVRGAYSPLLMLTTDGGLATGREIYGQPKKLGEPRLEVRGDLVVGLAVRNGIEVAAATTVYKQRAAQIGELTDLVPFTTNLNYKFIPGADGEAVVSQLTARSFQDVLVHECWRGPGTVEIRANAQFPLHLLPVKSVGEAYYWRADFTLPFGAVVHDYLQSD